MHANAPDDLMIFNAALEITAPAERGAYIDQACGADAALRQKVISLLAAYENGGDTFDHFGVAATINVQEQNRDLERSGSIIGRYKLLQKIGEGGCGVVYMAEQEEPVRRRVALKIIKLGMDTKSVIARFEAERQALALMDHPNIAKVLDGGATESATHRIGEPANRRTAESPSHPLADTPVQLPAGRPYFVMELVRGVKITDYCDEKNLSTQQRLDLFIQVCQAIQHAHQKGIIHRDIKPSNILVTVNDGMAVPKVIDFGIAKATTDQRLTDKTVFTAFEQFIGTPAYMSPEQAEITSVDVDTRSDIYSLGVLLYELLTGKTPFDAKELLQAGLDEMRRTIREKEPERPSTRVSTLGGEELTTTAKRRGLDAPKLVNVLRGDLDWIAMKCLEKDRARRYETANGLATDIQRHLNNEPVVACPPSNLYRFQKLVRRNKLAFAAGAAVAAALVIGLAIALWQSVEKTRAYARARAAEKAAQTEAAKSQQVAQFLKDMLKGVGPSVTLGRDTKLVREILDKTAARIGKDLTNQPAAEAELRSTIGEVYWALGEFVKAEAMHREALAIRKKLLGNEHPAVADSLGNVAIVLHSQGKHAEAETLLREALAMQRKLLGNVHSDVAASLGNLATVLSDQGKHAEAESLQREVLAMEKKLVGDEHPDVATALNNLASTLDNQGRLAEAETLYREAVAMQKKFGNEHPSLATHLNNLATVLWEQDKLAEAEPLFREVLAMQKKIIGNEHPDFATTLNNLGLLLSRQGKLAEAESLHREALGIRKKILGTEHLGVAGSLHDLAMVLVGQGKLAEAETLFREAFAMRKKLLGTEHPATALSLNNLAETLWREHKPEQAEQLFAEFIIPAIEGQPQSVGPLRVRASFRARRGRFTDAVADLSRAIELDPKAQESWYRLAAALVQTGSLDAYHEHCRKSAERFASTTDPVTAEHIAKACLILPASGADLAIVGRLADTSASASTKSGSDAARLEFPKGLMEYRQGHFASAVESMQKVLTHSGSVEAYMVLAMAKCQLKQIDEARSALAKGVEIAETKLPKLDSGGLGYDWADWVIAHALMREAKALIEHAPQPASEKSRTGVQSRELPRGSQSATPSTQPKSE